MRRIAESFFALAFLFAACDLSPRREDAPPPPPASANASAALDREGVASAFLAAADDFDADKPEPEIRDRMTATLRKTRGDAWEPLMRELQAAKNREAKAALLRKWAAELRGAP